MNAAAPRLAQPGLPLPTMNKHCQAVRAAARAGFKSLPAPVLAQAHLEANLAAQELRNAYVLVRDHHSLAVAVETAGKAVGHVLAMIEARQQGKAS